MKREILLLTLMTLSITVGFSQVEDHEQWKKDRYSELVAEDGWINLAGLLWIDLEHVYLNRVDKDNLILSSVRGENNVGFFDLTKDSVWFNFNPKIVRKSKLKLVKKTLQYPVKDYGNGAVYHDHWKWTVINRGGQFAMRLRDLQHPGLAKFQPIPYFDYNTAFAVEAFFVPKFNETINITNVLGQVIEWTVMGILKFQLDGQSYELTALEDSGKLFVIFSDLTNETETYPTGRYLHVNYPDKSGTTSLDFNYSYNPPCAFTAFATCPIPPKVNRLPIAIEVGEKEPEGHNR
ncbi:MAG: hypothetical protein C0433_06585 [Cyclobacterium sp.]|nr:hypothetical protein [Cyclobacterium sp.]